MPLRGVFFYHPFRHFCKSNEIEHIRRPPLSSRSKSRRRDSPFLALSVILPSAATSMNGMGTRRSPVSAGPYSICRPELEFDIWRS